MMTLFQVRHVPQSPRAILQIGLAALGTIVVLGSLIWGGWVFTQMTPSDSGFAEGLAIILTGLYVLAGFVVVAVGLLIPQTNEDGIQFSSRQRTLLTYGAIAPIVGVLAIPIGATVAPPVYGPVLTILVAGLVGLICSGPLAVLLAVGSKVRSTVR